jgi:hypothetical protein
MKRQIQTWVIRLHIRMWHEPWGAERRIDLEVRGPDQISIVQARFVGHPDHPRALLTLLEGLALWQGAPLGVAISADAPVCDSLGLGAFGGERWPAQSALVHFHWCSEADQRRAEQGKDFWSDWPRDDVARRSR